MFKFKKTLAFLTLVVMLISSIPAFSLTAFAQTEKFDGNIELDYDELFNSDNTYIVWPSGKTTSANWSFVFRGKTVSVKYSTSKCFTTFANAYRQFTRKGAAAVPTGTPVFVLIGNVSISTTMYSNAIILGANAGISPNAQIDMAQKQANDPEGYWEKGTRYTETVVSGTFALGNNSNYDKGALNAGVKEYNIIIDGVRLSEATAPLYKSTHTVNTNSTEKTVNVYVKNSILDFNSASIYAIDCTKDTYNRHNVSFTDIRMATERGTTTQTNQKALVDNVPAHVYIDGMFYESKNPIISNINVAGVKEGYTFEVRNSYFKDPNATNSSRLFRIGLSKGKNHVIFDNNILNRTVQPWGAIVFQSSEDYNYTTQTVDFTHNTVIADIAETSTEETPVYLNHSLFEGGAHLSGPYTLNMLYNRIIGFKTMFPTMTEGMAASQNYAVKGTAAYNYFAPTLSSVNDEKGVAPCYYGSQIDHYKYNSLWYASSTEKNPYDSSLYYTDYKMTKSSDMFDVMETDFYDDLDTISIDNKNRIIRFKVAEGATISGVSKDYGFRFRSTPTSVTYSKTSFTTAASESTMTVNIGGSTVKYTIITEAQITTPVSYTQLVLDYPGIFEKDRLYLYSPSGAKTVVWNGVTYDFTGRTYTTISAIESAATSLMGIIKTKPQIIIPAGTYNAISLSRAAEIYGECWSSPATIGGGLDSTSAGDCWKKSELTVIKGITLNSGVSQSGSTNNVEISGIVLQGDLKDASRGSYPIALSLKNSVVNGGSVVLSSTNNNSNTSNTFTAQGVKVNSVGSSGSFVTGTAAPATVTFNNVEFAQGAITNKIFDGWASGLSSKALTFNVQGCRFTNFSNVIIGDITKGVKMSSATVNFTGNTVTDAAGVRVYGSMLQVDASKIKALNIKNNWFVNSGSGYYSVMNETSGTITFDNNRLIGVEMGNIGNLKNNNYYAPYSLDADKVSNGKPYGSTYYLDPAFKIKNTEFAVSSVTGGENVTIDNVNRTIHMTGATNPVFDMTSGAEYKIYSDYDCTSPATISANGRYFMEVQFKGATLVYNVLVSPATDIDYKTTFADNTFTSNALFVTSDIETADYGTRFTTKWNGRDYSFVAGIDAFANVADAVNSAKNAGKSNPTILLGNYGGILSVPVAAKIYTANHSTVPYVKTTDADYDWDYNTAYNANKTSVSVIQIGPDATGNVHIGGVELTGYYLDVRRAATSKLNVTLENTLVNKTEADTRCLFDLNGNNARYASNSETFTVKNCYVQSATKTRLLYEYYPANVVFDGLYVDGSTFDIYNVNYIKNSGKSTSVVFRNSNLRNFTPVGTTYDFLFQGDDTMIESGETKKLIIEDSIIYKFSMGKKGIIPMQTGKYSDIVFDNNVVIASAANTNLVYHAGDASTIGVKVSITDNLLLGINPAISLGTTAVDTANSVVRGNHTTSAVSTEKSGTAITVTGASTITESDFAVDDSFDPMYKSGFALSKISSAKDSVFDSSISGTSVTVSLISGRTLSDAKFSFASDKVAAKVYTTSACTTLTRLSTVKSGTYYLRGEYQADDATKWTSDVYTLTVNVADAPYPLFSDDIIASDAILVDSKVDTSGKYYNTEWAGKMYSFVVGKNVFATLDQAIAAAGSNPSFLIKDLGGISGESEVLEFRPTTPGKYYTQNYNKAPYIASDRNLDPDGSEWTANINTGLDNSFNTKDGIEVKWFILNKCKAGDYEFHGFTITNCIQDDTATDHGTRSSDNDINVLFNNTYVEKNYSSAGFFNTGDHFKTTAADATLYNDNITVKNTYYVNNSTVDWFGGYVNLWTNLTIDGMFADYANSNVSTAAKYIGWYGKEYRLTIKNSNLRNLAPSSDYIHFEGHNGYGVDYHQNTYPESPESRSIVLEDNIFYNFTFFNKNSAFIYYKQTYYNHFVVKNNYIYAPNDNLKLATGETGDAVHPDPYVTITDNVFMGINPYYDINRWVTWSEVVVKDNYCVASRPASTDTVSFGGVKFVLDCNNYRTENGVKIYDYQTNGHYWLDSAKTLSASVIQPMTLSGKAFNTNAQVCDMLVSYGVSVVNLNDYLYNPHNKVTLYADSDFTQVIEDVTALEYVEGKLFYLTVEANDGTGAIETRVISMARDVDTADITYVSATLYNDIALNFKTSGTTNYTDVYMEFAMGDETVKVTDYTADGDFKVFTFRNLAPHRMTDEVTGTLYGTKNGKSAALATYTTSLAAYCETVMPENEEDDFELYALCRDILNYGAASQKYKSYKTDNLANKNLSSADQIITAPVVYDSIDKDYEVVSSPKAEWKSFGLYLDAAIDMRLGFESNDVISDLSVKVEKPDGTVEILKNCIYRQNGKYFFNFDNFSVCEVSDIFYFTLMRGNTAVSNTVSYNVESYAYLAKQSGNSALKLVTNAMMNYANSAIEYKLMQ